MLRKSFQLTDLWCLFLRQSSPRRGNLGSPYVCLSVCQRGLKRKLKRELKKKLKEKAQEIAQERAQRKKS